MQNTSRNTVTPPSVTPRLVATRRRNSSRGTPKSSGRTTAMILLVVLVLNLMVIPGVNATATIVDTPTTRQYLENFAGYTVGSQPPSGLFYSVNTAGTGTFRIANAADCGMATQCLELASPAPSYALQMLNVGTGVDLCDGADQSVSFDIDVGDLSTGTVVEYRVTGASAVAGALPANSAAIRFTGIIGSTNQVSFVVRGNSLAENAGAVIGTVNAGADLTATISQGNCSSGTASFLFALTGFTATQRQATTTDLITLQLNRLGMAQAPGGASGATVSLDNYDWSGAPLPAITITKISPSSGTKGTAVAISGTGFQEGATVKFDYQTAEVTATFLNEIRVTAPDHPPGSAVVTVTNTDGSMASINFFYNAVPAPVGGCPQISSSSQVGSVVLIDSYQGQPEGSVPSRCWFEFSTVAVDELHTSADAWANTAVSGNIFDVPDEFTSLYIDPAAAGYNKQQWKFIGQNALHFCTAEGATTLGIWFNIQSGPIRIAIYGSTDPTELETPNTGSARIDITPGASVHPITLMHNDGTSVTTNFNGVVNTNEWYRFTIGVACNSEATWDYTTNARATAYSMTVNIRNALGQSISQTTGLLGTYAKRPTITLDTVGLHCAGICFEDGLSIINSNVPISHGLTFKDCGGVGSSGIIIGMDYSETQPFGIFKWNGPSSAGCGGASTQVKTFKDDLSILGTMKITTTPELCTTAGGILAQVNNVGICYISEGDPQRCLYIRDRYLENPTYPYGQYQEGDDQADNPPNSNCEDEQGTNSNELAALDAFGFNYKTSDVFDQSCPDCNTITQVGYAFGEQNTGIMGAYIQEYRKDQDDQSYRGYVQAGPTGTTITQVCAWRWGEATLVGTRYFSDQYIAGIVPGQGVFAYRLILVGSDIGGSPNPIEFEQIPLNDVNLKSAKALDCAADKIYLLNSNSFRIIRAIVRPGADNGGVGNTVYSQNVSPSLERIVSVNADGGFAALGSGFIQILDVRDETNIGVIGAINYPTNDVMYGLSTIRIDGQANLLALTMTRDVYTYEINGLTHGGRYVEPPCPECTGASGYQDSDADGISDVFEDVFLECDDHPETNPDVDNDIIKDGDDATIPCGDSIIDGTELRDCSANPGSCDPDDDTVGCVSNCGPPTGQGPGGIDPDVCDCGWTDLTGMAVNGIIGNIIGILFVAGGILVGSIVRGAGGSAAGGVAGFAVGFFLFCIPVFMIYISALLLILAIVYMFTMGRR